MCGEGQDSHMFRYGTLPTNQTISITRTKRQESRGEIGRGRGGRKSAFRPAIPSTSGVTKHRHRRTSVDNLVPNHLIPRSGRLLFVNPIRLIPMIMRNQAKLHRSIRQHLDPSTLPQSATNHKTSAAEHETRKKKEIKKRDQHSRLEILRKLLLVQKHIRIPIPPIEPILHLLHTKQDPIYIPVPRQRHDSSVRLPLRRRRLVLLHRVIVLWRDPVLIRRFAGGGRRAELIFDVGEGGRSTVFFV